jgi:hypothetical protein
VKISRYNYRETERILSLLESLFTTTASFAQKLISAVKKIQGKAFNIKPFALAALPH